MNSKTLGIVAAGAIVLAAAAALVVSNSNKPAESPAVGELVLPGLSTSAKDAAFIVVNTGGATFTLEKKSGAWLLAEKSGYPVSIDKVRDLVVGLSQLKQLEPKTSRPDRYAEIGVDEPGPAQAQPAEAPPPAASQGAKVTIRDGASKPIASILVGKSRLGTKKSVFVRKDGDPQSWLAEGSLEIPRTAIAWLDTKISVLDRARLKRITIAHGEGAEASVLVLGRAAPEDQTFQVESLPEGRALKENADTNPAATLLTFLSFEDVQPADAIFPEGSTPQASYQAATFDGLVITAKIATKEGKTWAVFDATVDETALPSTVSTPPAEGSPPAPDPAASAQAIRDEAKAFHERHAGWAYEIAEFSAKSLRATIEDYLAPVAAPPEPAGPDAGVPNPQPQPPTSGGSEGEQQALPDSPK